MKAENFSYSRISTYRQCPFCYNLKYNEKRFYDKPTLATALGSLIHYIEERISLSLRDTGAPNYKLLKEMFYEINIPKKNKYDLKGDIFGINILQERFHKEFFTPSEKTGLTYLEKTEKYVQNLDRQEKFLLNNPNLEIYDVERAFGFVFNDYFIKGFIDRILYDKEKNEYIIHDIKTKDRLFSKEDTTTPLQFVVYSLALQNQLNLEAPPIQCFYDLVFLGEYQQAGTKGFITRGEKQLTKAFEGINNQDYHPSPSMLCYWCSFSGTNPNATEEGRFLCPYYSLWTPENKTFQTMNEWKKEKEYETPILVEKLRKSDKENNRNKYFEF